MTIALEHVCDLVVELSPPHEMGDALAGTRRIIPIVGGTAKGALINGRILNVGADWQTVQAGGVAQLDAQAVSVQRGDAIASLRQAAPASLHIIFLDPPFAASLWESALQAARQAIAANGQVYLEAPQAWAPEALAALGWALHRHLKAGAVHAHVLRPITPVLPSPPPAQGALA